MIHFNEFMLNIHKSIHLLKKSGETGDPVPQVCKTLTSNSALRVLCFDEFQVTDVADALILRRVFTLLWSVHGITVVATSNRPPSELYKDGLQRELFLPFIDDLTSRCPPVDMDSEVDYRVTKVNEGDKWFANDGKGMEMMWDGREGGEEVRTERAKEGCTSRSNDVCLW